MQYLCKQPSFNNEMSYPKTYVPNYFNHFHLTWTFSVLVRENPDLLASSPIFYWPRKFQSCSFTFNLKTHYDLHSKISSFTNDPLFSSKNILLSVRLAASKTIWLLKFTSTRAINSSLLLSHCIFILQLQNKTHSI